MLIVYSGHAVAGTNSLGELIWEKSKQELGRFDDWSLDIRRIPKRARPEIIVDNGMITYNGQMLEIGGSLESWKLVLGAAPRPAFHGQVLIWDALGVKVTLYPNNQNRIKSFLVDLNCKERSNERDCEENSGVGNDFDPKHYFTGYLEVEGGAIDNKSTLEEYNKLVRGRGRYQSGCGTELCFSYMGKYGFF